MNAPRITPRPQAGHAYHDCADATSAQKVTGAVRSLPFLGELTARTATLTAGQTTEVVLDHVVGASGIADSGWLKLCFTYYSDWNLQTDDPTGRDYATAELAHRSDLGGASPGSLATVRRLRVAYDVKGGERPFQKALLVHLEDGFARPGDHIVIRLGDRRSGGPGTRVQTFVESAFVFRLYVDALGTSKMAHAAEVNIDITPGPAVRLVAAGPRLVRSGASAPLRAHLEDVWGNAAVDTPARLRVTSGGWTAPPHVLPADGWAATAFDLPARPPGSYDARLTAVLPDGSELTAEAPVDVVSDLPGERAYFADLHVHSDDTVGTQDSAYNFAYGHRIGGLDILGYTANDFQITDQAWRDVVALCRDVAEEGAFVCFPGVEWCGNAGVGGDHNVIYLGDDTPLARSLEWNDATSARRPEPEHWPITELYDAFVARPQDYLLMPHVGGRRAILDWHHPALERLIEVHSAWGTSPWFLEDAMRRGLRLGVSANSDEHRGRPGSGAPGANIFGTRGGLTGVLAPELTHAAVGATLRARRTWATSGARAVALLRAVDHWMGDECVVDGDEMVLSYALYGDAPWEHLAVYDTHGLLLERDLSAEAGHAPGRIRVRWGGARHRDRYRWASWTGRIEIDGPGLLDVRPWATMHPEQTISVADGRVHWSSATYGNDTGVILDLNETETSEITIDATIAELATSAVRRDLGGAGLHVTVERIADATTLPRTLAGDLTVRPPAGDSAVYLRARQSDGHQAWTSPLFLSKSAASPPLG